MADDKSGQSGPPDALPPPATSDAPDTFSTPARPVEDVGYTPRGVPTFDSVREKIEKRYGTAQGAHELASDTPEARTAEKQYEERQQAAAERLEQIRSSMRPQSGKESGDA